MAVPERTARTKQDPPLQFPSRQWVLSAVKMNKKKKKKGELIQSGPKIDVRRQLVQREEVQKKKKNTERHKTKAAPEGWAGFNYEVHKIISAFDGWSSLKTCGELLLLHELLRPRESLSHADPRHLITQAGNCHVWNDIINYQGVEATGSWSISILILFWPIFCTVHVDSPCPHGRYRPWFYNCKRTLVSYLRTLMLSLIYKSADSCQISIYLETIWFYLISVRPRQTETAREILCHEQLHLSMCFSTRLTHPLINCSHYQTNEPLLKLKTLLTGRRDLPSFHKRGMSL